MGANESRPKKTGITYQGCQLSPNHPLHDAVLSNRVGIVQALLMKQVAGITAVDIELSFRQRTPLALAVEKGYASIVKELLCWGADFRKPTLIISTVFGQGQASCLAPLPISLIQYAEKQTEGETCAWLYIACAEEAFNRINRIEIEQVFALAYTCSKKVFTEYHEQLNKNALLRLGKLDAETLNRLREIVNGVQQQNQKAEAEAEIKIALRAFMKMSEWGSSEEKEEEYGFDGGAESESELEYEQEGEGSELNSIKAC